MFRGDSIEMHLDTQLYEDFTDTWAPDDAIQDDFQLGLSPGNFRDVPPEGYIWSPEGWMAGNKGGNIRIASQKTPAGYGLEAAIPWQSLAVHPTDELVLGFSLNVSDNDTPGAARQETMTSQSPSHLWGDPTTFGTLIILE